MNRILVTGIEGFIGKRLAEQFRNRNIQVFGLDDDYFDSDNWSQELFARLTQINPGIIFHIGACSNTLEQNVQYMMIRNYESTKVISEWCNSNHRRMIFSSSAANYGENGLYPSNLYGWSKYVAEDFVVQNGGIALRYFNVYGPGEQHKGKMASFLYQAYAKRVKNEEIRIFPGTPKRDFVYIEDVLSANIFASSNFESLKGNYYEVSTGTAHTFEEILDIYGLDYSYTSKTDIPVGYQFYTCGNSEKWMPGWTPKYSLVDGVIAYKEVLEDNSFK